MVVYGRSHAKQIEFVLKHTTYLAVGDDRSVGRGFGAVGRPAPSAEVGRGFGEVRRPAPSAEERSGDPRRARSGEQHERASDPGHGGIAVCQR